MSVYRLAKKAALQALSFGGAFSACERLTHRGLRILCYHGIAVADEYMFRPRLFMRHEVFAARMDFLAANGYRALALGEAIRRLNRGELPRRAVVITFDDGWYGCLDGAFAKLASLGWTATLYVATYYSGKRRPVFNVAVDYLLWRGGDRVLDLGELDARLEGRVNLATGDERAWASKRILTLGDKRLALTERVSLLYRLAERMELDPVDLFERRRVCALMDEDELRRAVAMGIDIQLHTHRHRLPLDDNESIRREIRDNRAALAASGGRDLVHLCYPSGVYHAQAFATLRELGVRTATTTEAGFNYAGGEPFALSRFLDGEDIAAIEFKAEMAGVGEVMRQMSAGCPPWSERSPLYWRQRVGEFQGDRNR